MSDPPKKIRPKLKINLDTKKETPQPTSLSVDKISKESRMKLCDEDLTFLSELGAGSGGTVSKVLFKPLKLIMARKLVSVFVVDESERERTEKGILRELKILKMCKSPYIVEFFGAFAHEGDISICMEYLDLGSLDHIVRKVGPLPENIVSRITVSVLRGLQYLYDTHKIVHRDIKPSNILLNSEGAIKIADFGVSKELANGTMAKTFTGTQGYLAPERVREGMISSVQSDIWSLGLTLMELATGKFPYPALPSIIDLLRYIEEEEAPCLPEEKFSVDFRDFTKQCLIKDPEVRPDPAELLEVAFCVKVMNSLDISEWTQSVSRQIL